MERGQDDTQVEVKTHFAVRGAPFDPVLASRAGASTVDAAVPMMWYVGVNSAFG
jgi:hypothetical protein